MDQHGNCSILCYWNERRKYRRRGHWIFIQMADSWTRKTRRWKYGDRSKTGRKGGGGGEKSRIIGALCYGRRVRGGGKLHLTRNGKHLTQKVNVQATSIDVNQWQKSGFRLAKRSAKISASESRSSTRRFIYFLFILQPKRGKWHNRPPSSGTFQRTLLRSGHGPRLASRRK